MLYSDDPITQTQHQVDASLKQPFTTLTDYTNYKVPQDDRIHMRYMAKLSQAIKKFEKQKVEQLTGLETISLQRRSFWCWFGLSPSTAT